MNRPDPYLKPEEVLRIAQIAAVENGRNLDDFEAPTPPYDYSADRGEWYFLFQGNKLTRTLGSHFGIIVNDVTWKAVFRGGR